ncbi:unnamed protein product [Phaedon cochleariae]|uniref:Nucleoporin Nup54 alpha-helical domain-containing protein n=1 Tax=Phaedon cochleariae TaxID=80249 RepID=A0A9N9SHC4_PHACE|nr:unnamed protein product [Phaedon cochleariae]
MAFSFGNTQTKTPGFGTAFGATPATTASTAFGGFGTTFGSATSQPAPAFGTSFGAPTSAPPAFGTTFGAPAASAAPAFGSTFGAPAASAAPAFGTSFGAPAASAAPAFGSTFGAPAASAAPAFGSTFGAPTASAAPAFGSSFGTPTASVAPAFGSTFGTPASSAAPGFGSTGTGLFGGATSTPSLFGGTAGGTGGLFGSAATTQTTGLFGSTSGTTNLFGTTPTPSLFGQQAATANQSPFGTAGATPGFGGGLFGGTAPSTGSSLFGTAPSAGSSLFGGGFGAKPAAGGFGSFGGNVGGGFAGFGGAQQGGGFGVGAAQTTGFPAPSQVSKSQQVIASVYAINVFNDERDDILKKWNMLQACWGTGKGYHHTSQPPVEYDARNPFYRFKAMGYNLIPDQDTSDGIVDLVFNKKLDELKNQQEVLKNGLAGILGNKPNLSVDITMIKAISDTQTEVRITVSEKGVTGSTRKVPASDLSAFLNQPAQKQQLANVGVSAIGACVTPSKAELEEYLKNPPPGIDPQMWQAAIQDNPNPKKYIPVPINGFSDLRSRMLHQERQTGLHQSFLERVNKDIAQLKTRHSSSTAQITELKSKFLELQHRILRILVKQESTRKLGIAIQPEEELLRGRFEIMHQQLNNPKQFKGQVNELLSNVKMIEGSQKHNNASNYRLDGEAQDEIKQFLKMEQNGISQLINIIQTDLEALNIINDGMKKIMQNGNVLPNI